MAAEVSYLAVLLIELVVSFSLAAYAVSMLYSSLMGAPYVPTKQKEIEAILTYAKLKPGQLFIELGSGDGRVVRTAVKQYQVRGVGIDINPLLNLWAGFLAKRQGVNRPLLHFISKNIFAYDYRGADVVYLFLMPKLLKRLLPKLRRELPKHALVVSHGFALADWKPQLHHTIKHEPFPTYFYRRP
ncbi:class I SAM-dependent methyltransferase [Patescibacteria group bacterium]|nr:class I SAM-dependent methyltransferase [Patescibacteria group bacterium]MCL5091887.1 class I SAM-dependent methyltransferase [Patescibacteria group bacterium]